jgi:hypothetical protein
LLSWVGTPCRYVVLRPCEQKTPSSRRTYSRIQRATRITAWHYYRHISCAACLAVRPGCSRVLSTAKKQT